MWAESTAKGGVKERQISSVYTLNFETKSILSDRAWVNLESSGIFFCVFLGFGYKITGKPRIPSDNLDPASIAESCGQISLDIDINKYFTDLLTLGGKTQFSMVKWYNLLMQITQPQTHFPKKSFYLHLSCVWRAYRLKIYPSNRFAKNWW